MSKIIITIAGMHRSGTSLSGNLLEKSGLFIGESLMSNGFDNKKGHFEDLEILKIHEEDLKLKKIDPRGLKGSLNGNLKFESETDKSINAILLKREHKLIWGWKEPRTTLYLKAWKEKLPNLKVIAIYRKYDEVENSLIRRYRYKLKYGVGMSKLVRLKHVIFYPFNVFLKKYEAYKAWHIYNCSILDFKNQYPNDVIILELNHFLMNYNKALNHINKMFESNLEAINIDEIFEKSLLKKNAGKRFKIRMFSKKKLDALLEALNDQALWM